MDINNRICISLHDMLKQNHTLQCLQISCNVDASFLYFLTTGLVHNNSLQELTVPIPVGKSTTEPIKTFFKVISHKTNLTHLELFFTEDELCR